MTTKKSKTSQPLVDSKDLCGGYLLLFLQVSKWRKLPGKNIPLRALVEVLRAALGFMGTKKSCNEGECGASTLSTDGRVVTSCLVRPWSRRIRAHSLFRALLKEKDSISYRNFFLNMEPLNADFVRQYGDVH